MSYILEALRKAEKDRQLGKTPTLGDVTAAMPTRPTERRGLPPRTLALLLLVLVLLTLTVWLWPRPSTPRSPPVPPPAPSVPVPAASPPAPTITAETIVEAASAASAAESEAASEPALDEDVVAESIDDLLEPPPEPRIALDDNAAAFEMESPDDDDSGGEPALSMADAADAAPSFHEEPAEPSAPSGPPMLRDMPSDYRGAFPPLRVDVHVYDEDPARRWVMVNGNKAVEGTTLAEGPRVAEIAPDGIVFDFRGRSARFPLNR